MNSISNLHCHKVTGKIDNSFVGIKIRNGSIDFYYPEAYAISPKEDIIRFRKDVLDILNTISIAKTLTPDKAKIQSTLSGSESFAFYSHLWVIKDYLSNGLYQNQEKILKESYKGKINWKRTFQTQPLVSKNKLVYNKIISEMPNQFDNIIVEIHRYCIYRSFELVGWLFGLSSSNIEKPIFNLHKKKVYLNVLNKEYRQTFDDYKKMRIFHLLRIIQGVDGEKDTDEFVYGVDSYYYIFERMVNNIFGNIERIEDFYPKSHWFLRKDSYFKSPSSILRPDTILISEDKKTVYIIDSKYYRFGITASNNDLPGSSSIQKQITYGEYIKQNSAFSSIEYIRNAYVLPYNKYDNPFKYTEDIEYIGFSQANWKTNDEAFQTIFAFLVDLKHVISTWNKKSEHAKDVNSLIQCIEETLKNDFNQTN